LIMWFAASHLRWRLAPDAGSRWRLVFFLCAPVDPG
jgi:hypothetical protein